MGAITWKSALLVVIAASLASAQTIPPLLQRALQRQPGLRVLDAPVEPANLEAMKEANCWPPWAQFDLDGDGRKDVVAVVVKGTGAAQTYGVVAVHANEPLKVQWVVPLSEESITGLHVDQPRGAVVPLFCFECDSNVFFRWSGAKYEMSLYRVGERITLFEHTEAKGIDLYSDSTASSKPVASREMCHSVMVLQRRGTPANRWYRVETTDPAHVRGWVPATSVNWLGCMGR